MCCSIKAKPNEIEAKLNNGLIKGHSYTVTKLKKVIAIKSMDYATVFFIPYNTFFPR